VAILLKKFKYNICWWTFV